MRSRYSYGITPGKRASIRADFFCEPNVCVYCDGSVHDEPQQRASDEASRRELKARGYRLVVIRYDDNLDARLGEWTDVFGGRVE